MHALFGDRDPVFASDHHRRVWKQASSFAEMVQSGAQVMCAQHGQLANAPWGWIMRRHLRPRLKALQSEDDILLTPLQREATQGKAQLHPALLHQHFIVVDGKISMLGGLGLGGSRDVSIKIDDTDFAKALHGHFAECWNRAIESGTIGLADTCVHMDTTVRSQGKSDLRPLRTFTVPNNRFGHLAPLAPVTDHERAFHKLFGTAEKQIFIQTEVLTCKRLTDRLCAVGTGKKDLQLVLILSDDVVDSWDKAQSKYIMNQQLQKLKRNFQDRLAIIETNLPSGSVVCVDDHSLILGSANLSARALRWDCDVSALIRDPEVVGPFFDKLCRLVLGKPAQDLSLAQHWRDAARAQNLGEPTDLPKPDRRPFLPEAMF
jgi:phospholipase D1/2